MDACIMSVLIFSVFAVGNICNGESPGSRKCSDLCAQLPACISFRYEPLRCECTLEVSTQKGSIVSALDMSASLNSSLKNFFQFLTMRRVLKYKEDEASGMHAKEKFTDRRGHLMVIPEKRKRKVILFNLHSLKKEENKMKLPPGIVAMRYMSSIKRLIISKQFPSKVILSYDLEKGSHKQLIQGFHPMAIAIDEEQQLLFFIDDKMLKSRHKKLLYKMAILSKIPLPIRTFKQHPGHEVAVDASKQTLFCAFSKSIDEMSYNGTVIRTLPVSFANRGMCLDHEGQTLYYLVHKSVKGVNLGRMNNIENIIDFKMSCKGLTCYNNTLFVMSISNRIFAVNPKSRDIIASVNLKLKAMVKLQMSSVP